MVKDTSVPESNFKPISSKLKHGESFEEIMR